jgi:hypothetical protein
MKFILGMLFGMLLEFVLLLVFAWLSDRRIRRAALAAMAENRKQAEWDLAQ